MTESWPHRCCYRIYDLGSADKDSTRLHNELNLSRLRVSVSLSQICRRFQAQSSRTELSQDSRRLSRGPASYQGTLMYAMQARTLVLHSTASETNLFYDFRLGETMQKFQVWGDEISGKLRCCSCIRSLTHQHHNC